MKTTYTMLLLVLLISLSSCEEKALNKDPIPVENTTEIFTQTDLSIQENKQTHNTKKISQDKRNTQIMQSTSQDKQSAGTFTLSSAKDITYKLTLAKKTLSIHTKDVPLILLNICSDTSSACIAQLSSFSKLQKKYKKNLFLISVWTKGTDKHKIDILSKQKKANYFISYNVNSTNNHALVSTVFGSLQLNRNTKLPLSIIYKKGNYYSHFEGAVPIEMITHDIQQAIKK